MVYFTSDFHFDEAQERQKLFGRDRLNMTVEEFDNMIIANYNSVVKKEDFVYILGDIAKTENGLKKVKQLNGFKVCIKGNYDEQFSDEKLLEYFEEVYDNLTIDDLGSEGISIHLNHYPVNADPNCMNLVGHIHGLWQVQRNMINVGVDAWNYKPISEDEIEFKINAIRKFYDQNVFAGEIEANLINATKDKEIIYPDKEIDINEYRRLVSKKVLFLAGPIKGSLNWRKNFIYRLNKLKTDFIIANPQLIQKDFDLPKQIEWEIKMMNMSFENNGCLVFWLANQEDETDNPFAQTSRYEIGEYIARYDFNKDDSKIVIGIDSNFPGKEYIEYKANKAGLKVAHSFDELITMIYPILVE